MEADAATGSSNEDSFPVLETSHLQQKVSDKRVRRQGYRVIE